MDLHFRENQKAVRLHRLLKCGLTADLFFLVFLAFALPRFHGAELKPQTSQAFDHYIQITEAELKQRMSQNHFLWIDARPREKSGLWLGMSTVNAHQTLDHDQEIPIPDGMVQDWIGDMFLPGVTLEKVRAIMQDMPITKTSSAGNN